jgi:hypothetical protein
MREILTSRSKILLTIFVALFVGAGVYVNFINPDKEWVGLAPGFRQTIYRVDEAQIAYDSRFLDAKEITRKITFTNDHVKIGDGIGDGASFEILKTTLMSDGRWVMSLMNSNQAFESLIVESLTATDLMHFVFTYGKHERHYWVIESTTSP